MERTILIPELRERIIKDRAVRRAVARRSHLLFFYLYFPEYAEYDIAPFHREFFRITEDELIRKAVVMAFRGSAKSSIFTFSYPLWAILGSPQKKYTLIIGRTHLQARQYLMHIRAALESNELLRRDMGPFEEIADQWGAVALDLKKYGARIQIASIEQSVRGLRHGARRPDLIVCDDIEDTDSVRTFDSREKIYRWIKSDVMPLGDRRTKYVFLGSRLHRDDLLARLQMEIGEGDERNICRAYPLIDARGVISWPGKYPDMDAVEQERRNLHDERAWQQEYLLQIVSEEDQVIKPEWIRRYEKMPEDLPYRYSVVAIDPAVKLEESNDFTAMVAASVYGHGEDLKIFIHANPVNRRMTIDEIKREAARLSLACGRGSPARTISEEVAAQHYLTQYLRGQNLPVEGRKIRGDKRERLMIAADLVQNGKVYFPRIGTEELELQMTGFPRESHDDLADAFSLLMGYIIEKELRSHLYLARVDGVNFGLPSPPPQPPKDPQKEAEEFYRLQQEWERGLFNDSMREQLRRYQGRTGRGI